MQAIKEVKNFINGTQHTAENGRLDVYSPTTGEVIATVPLSGKSVLDQAVDSAKKAFPAWSSKPIKERVQVFYKYRNLLEKYRKELIELVHIENGKLHSEAEAEVAKSIELTEFACSLPQIITDQIMEVSKGVECRTQHVPIGVVASIAPFNFPNMVPNWTIPNAIVLGNCMIMKPSETVPLSTLRLAEILQEAGLPDGVFNVVH